MNAHQISLLVYLLLPFLASFVPQSSRPGILLSKGSAATAIRIVLLLALARSVVLHGDFVSIQGSLVQGYPLDILLSLNSYRYGFLLTAEFCFLLAHWMCPSNGDNSGLIRVLMCFAQGFCSLLLVSDNSAVTGGFMLLAGTVFFYLIRFSIPSKSEEMGATISTRMHVLYFLLGLFTIAWGITEFSGQNLVFGRGSGSALGLFLWLALVILAVPLPPWSRWFTRALEHLPEGVSLTLVIFLSGVALKLATLFNVAYPDLGWKQKLILYVLGIVGCFFSITGLFGAETRRRMLACVPSFFLSVLLVSVGVSRSGLVLSAYFASLFVPVFTGLVLSTSGIRMHSSLQRFFVGFLFLLVLGLPGTPVYQIFSGIGARSLDMGVGYTIVFGLLWFFYFNANVHICRRIFMEREALPEGDSAPRLEAAPGLFAGYGIFLMFIVIVVAQFAGRML